MKEIYDKFNQGVDKAKNDREILAKRDQLLDLKDWDRKKNPLMMFYANDNVFFRFRQKPEDLDWAEIRFTPIHIYTLQVDLLNQEFANIKNLHRIGTIDKDLMRDAAVSFPINLEDIPSTIKQVLAHKKISIQDAMEEINPEVDLLEAKELAGGKLVLDKEDMAKVLEKSFDEDKWQNAEYTINSETGKIIWPEDNKVSGKNKDSENGDDERGDEDELESNF